MGITPEVCARFETATKLSDEDRKAILEIARQALAPFQLKPEPKPEAKTELKPESGAKPAASTDVAAKPAPKEKS